MANTAVVYEFADLPSQKNGVMAKWSSRVVKQTPIDFTTGHAESAAFAATTRYILFVANTRFAWDIGQAPVATTSHMPFAADQPYHIEVNFGAGDKISFVASP
jgi:hypothetical protein